MAIKRFRGNYEFLSCHSHIVPIRYESGIYATAEHAFQAAKTLDLSERIQFQDCSVTAGQAKRLGRTISLRSDWEKVKYEVMLTILQDKFSADHPQVRQLLLDTGDELLIEGNSWHDNLWGDCDCGSAACKPEGQNRLGNALMSVRGYIRCHP